MYAKAEAARQAYRAGWQAAADVAAERPATHPADRVDTISDSRLKSALQTMPASACGWLSGKEYNLRSVQDQYARRGYRDAVEATASIAWEKFLESEPDQATPEMLARRARALEELIWYGTASTEDIKGQGFMPRTERGRYWMLDQINAGKH